MQTHSPSVSGRGGSRRGGPEIYIDVCYKVLVVVGAAVRGFLLLAHIAYSVVMGIQKFNLGGKTPGGDTAEI